MGTAAWAGAGAGGGGRGGGTPWPSRVQSFLGEWWWGLTRYSSTPASERTHRRTRAIRFCGGTGTGKTKKKRRRAEAGNAAGAPAATTSTEDGEPASPCDRLPAETRPGPTRLHHTQTAAQRRQADSVDRQGSVPRFWKGCGRGSGRIHDPGWK